MHVRRCSGSIRTCTRWRRTSPSRSSARRCAAQSRPSSRYAQSCCRCGRGAPSPGADVAGTSPVLLQMWQGRARSPCRCGRGEPGPAAYVDEGSGVSPAPLHTRKGGGLRAHSPAAYVEGLSPSRGEPSPDADAAVLVSGGLPVRCRRPYAQVGRRRFEVSPGSSGAEVGRRWAQSRRRCGTG
jgi:hypothetical protein